MSTLLHGLRDGDRLEDLVKKLDNLPPELDELFDKILRQLEPRHEKEASKLFQFVHANPVDATLISLYWSQLTLDDVLKSESRLFSEDERRYYAEVMRCNLLSRCKCLLNPEDGKDPTSHNTCITLVHRTAREYLMRADVWKRIRNQSPDYDPAVALGLSLIRQAKASITSYGSGSQDVEATLCEAVSTVNSLDLLEERIAFLNQIESVGTTTCTGITPRYMWLRNARILDLNYVFDDNTSLFHVVVAKGWSWYVEHELATKPDLLQQPVSTKQNFDAFMLAAMHDMWDMQYLCLQHGSDPTKIYRTILLGETENKTAWQKVLERTSHILKLDSSKIPWDKVARNTAAFLQHGADPYTRLAGDQQAEAVVANIMKAAQSSASDDDVKIIKKAYSRRRDSLLGWRR